MKLLVRILLILFITILPVSYGCSKYHKMKQDEKRRRAELAKLQEQKELEAQKAYEEALERHYAMQSKSTQKAMRKNMKNSIAWKENKKTFFLKRWFSRKHRKKKHENQG